MVNVAEDAKIRGSQAGAQFLELALRSGVNNPRLIEKAQRELISEVIQIWGGLGLPGAADLSTGSEIPRIEEQETR